MIVLGYPDHLRMLLLAIGLQPAARVFMLNGYPACHLDGKPQYVHRLVAARFLGVELTRSTFVHHRNEDRTDFRVDNLHVCSHGEHNGLHRRFGADNHFYGQQHTAESKAKSVATRRANGKVWRPKPENIERMRQAATRRRRDVVSGRFA